MLHVIRAFKSLPEALTKNIIISTLFLVRLVGSFNKFVYLSLIYYFNFQSLNSSDQLH